MTEAEWLACANPPTLRNACRGRVDSVRFRWLAVEWGSRIRHLFLAEDVPWFDAFVAWVAGDGDHPNSVCERPRWEGLTHYVNYVEWARDCVRFIRDRDDALSAAVSAAMSFAEYLPRPTAQLTDFSRSHNKRSKKARAEDRTRTNEEVLRHAAERKEHRERVHWEFCEQFRCVVGYPFRPVAFDPRWRTETAVALASGIYADRAFDRLPILADALEDAGCDAAELLAHLRGPGPHARGCWAVDLVLEK